MTFSGRRALAVPINRIHSLIAEHFVDKNASPREVLAKAIVRFMEEVLRNRRGTSSGSGARRVAHAENSR